jgi:hypothetical protein
MTTPARNASEVLDEIARAIFGEEYASALARVTDTNERTIRRIRAAAREGREYPAARGVLAALAEAVEGFAAELAPYRRQTILTPRPAAARRN